MHCLIHTDIILQKRSLYFSIFVCLSKPGLIYVLSMWSIFHFWILVCRSALNEVSFKKVLLISKIIKITWLVRLIQKLLLESGQWKTVMQRSVSKTYSEPCQISKHLRSSVLREQLKSGSFLPKKFLFICFNESPFKMMKNAFYFILKALFVLKIFKFLSWHFGHIEETA